mgnify:CR=1 FL=1
MIKEVKERNLLVACLPLKGIIFEIYNPYKNEAQLGIVEAYRGLIVTDHTSILFSKEPDISLLK